MYARAAAPRRVQGIARVIAFFASDDSGFMTGTYAPVNGGLAMD
jgi:NAD(P)-dependent dehydrogenase (short-subunit alcohol dehydrogenase family)